MPKAILYNRFVIVFNTLICFLMYQGSLDMANGNWDAIVFWLLAPFVFIIHLIYSFILEKRKEKYNFLSDYYVCGSIFLVFPLAILIKALL